MFNKDKTIKDQTPSNLLKLCDGENPLYAYICEYEDADQPLHSLIILFVFLYLDDMSCVLRKPLFCVCENEDADQLCGNCTADQRLCFPCIDSKVSLLYKSEISSL